MDIDIGLELWFRGFWGKVEVGNFFCFSYWMRVDIVGIMVEFLDDRGNFEVYKYIGISFS